MLRYASFAALRFDFDYQAVNLTQNASRALPNLFLKPYKMVKDKTALCCVYILRKFNNNSI